MADQKQNASLESLGHAYNDMRHLLDEKEADRVHISALERHVAVLESETSNLKTQLKRKTAERDHFFRAFSALSAQLDGFAGGMITAIHMARTQAYGEKRPQMGAEAKPLTQLRRASNSAGHEDNVEPIPTFLSEPTAPGYRMSDATSAAPPVNLDALRRAIDGR
jgi:hypothetical protein